MSCFDKRDSDTWNAAPDKKTDNKTAITQNGSDIVHNSSRDEDRYTNFEFYDHPGLNTDKPKTLNNY